MNNENVLIEKVKLLASLVVTTAENSVRALFDSLKQDMEKEQIVLDDSKFNQVFFESILFYLHMIDREAFIFLEVNKREILMEVLIVSVEELLLNSNEKNFKISLTNTYNERQKEYGGYKLSVPKEGGLKGMLFWEFGKKVASVIGFDKNPFTIMHVQACIINSISLFQLPEFFKKIKE